uniref:Uncharacterized protein n=1 Tax=Magallana gigas TaxID=29159 RepID=K1Q7V9_MAGGI
MEHREDTCVTIPGEQDPFLSYSDERSSKKKDRKHVYGTDCVKGWIPLAVIIAFTTATVFYGIADILKM